MIATAAGLSRAGTAAQPHRFSRTQPGEQRCEPPLITLRGLESVFPVQALQYLGRPEAPFLLRVAQEFDGFAKERRRSPREGNIRRTSTKNS